MVLSAPRSFPMAFPEWLSLTLYVIAWYVGNTYCEFCISRFNLPIYLLLKTAIELHHMVVKFNEIRRF